MPSRNVILAFGLAMVVGGCFVTDHNFGVVMPADGTIKPLAVSLTDRSGIVESIAVGEPTGTGDAEVSNAADRGDLLLVSWTGGGCDHRVSFTFDDDGGGYALSGTTDRDSSCLLVGVLREIRIDLLKDVSASKVRFSPTP